MNGWLTRTRTRTRMCWTRLQHCVARQSTSVWSTVHRQLSTHRQGPLADSRLLFNGQTTRFDVFGSPLNRDIRHEVGARAETKHAWRHCNGEPARVQLEPDLLHRTMGQQNTIADITFSLFAGFKSAIGHRLSRWSSWPGRPH